MRIDLRTAGESISVDKAQKTTSGNSHHALQNSVRGDPSSNVQLSGLEAKVGSTPEIREERVNQLRQAIGSGTYSVSDEQLAQAMMNDALNR